MKKKRGLRTQLLVTTLVLSCFLSSFSYVLAQGNEDIHYLNFTHGQMSQIYYYDPMNMNVLQFNFDNNYSGTVRVNFSYNANLLSQNLDYWDILVDGAKIDQYFNNSSNSYIIFHVYNVQFFTVTMVYHKTGTISSDDIRFKFTSASSSLTASSDNIASDVDSIDSKLTTTNSTLSTISSRLQTSNGYFVDILGNTNDIESYLAQNFNGQYDSDLEVLLNNMATVQSSTATNIADCENYLNNIKSNITTIRSILGVLDINDPDQQSILDCINNIRISQTNLESKVNLIYNELLTMSSTLSSISTTLGNILNTVQNIDNLIDTISWVNYSSEVYWSDEITNDQTKWYQTNITTNTYHTIYLYVKGPASIGNLGNKIIHLRTYTQSNSNASGIKISPIGMVGSTGVNQGSSFNLFKEYMKPYVDIYIYPDVNLTSTNYMCIEVTAEVASVYLRYTHQNSTNYILSTDIEYWQLLTYFKQIEQYSKVNTFDQDLYSRLGDILTAINNISFNINTSDQDVENLTNDFDRDINTIHNIENNYGLNFDGWDDQLSNSDVALDLTGYSDTVNLFKTNITALWSSPLVSLPILLSCLCFVFLVILG